jgi:hypothetical protein
MVEKKQIYELIREYRGNLPFTQQEVDVLELILDKSKKTETKPKELKNPKAFYDGLRAITGKFDAEQVATIQRLFVSGSHWTVGWMAYGLATAWHEARLTPIPEWGKGKGRPYAAKGKYGQSQYGRGLVQLTWDFNYEWADKICAEAELTKKGDILRNFNRVLEPAIASLILIEGMQTGAFAKDSIGRHSLARHIKSEKGTYNEFVPARRIINGTDKASDIAKLAVKISVCLVAGKWE